eukprot:UN02647
MSEQLVIQRFTNSYANAAQRLKNTIVSLSGSRGAAEALPFIQEGDSIVRQGDLLFKSLDTEKRHLDNASKAHVDRKKMMTQREWNDLKQQYNQSKAQFSTSSLSASQQAQLRDQRGKLLHARAITDETTNSLNNTQAAIQESIEVGTDTNLKLDQQSEQILRMNESVVSTNNTLDKSKNLLGRMRRRILTNKCTQVAIIVLQIIIIACIIFIKYYS